MTQKKSFDEKFPSLLNPIITNIGLTAFAKEDIEISLLDKQKVRDAIRRYKPALPENREHPAFDKNARIQEILIRIEKELGL